MRHLILPGCLAAAMVFVLVWEFTPPEEAMDGSRLAAASHAGASRAATTAANPPSSLGVDSLAGLAAAITERPLFSPTRRPASTPDNASDFNAAHDGLPRLTGVITGPAGGRAIFVGADGKSHSAAEGGVIGGFTVRTINPGLVTVSGPDGDRALRPTYAGSRGTPQGAVVTSQGATRGVSGPREGAR